MLSGSQIVSKITGFSYTVSIVLMLFTTVITCTTSFLYQYLIEHRDFASYMNSVTSDQSKCLLQLDWTQTILLSTNHSHYFLL